ncbi:hypothetical protein CHL76_16265 [Marinococcus halophilus]|uniref:NAD(P)-binding domain-containing protein n=1 Tax=Marinococcus halophilus TaxID=1371 RepID=A0A510YA47_MARHA|nr:NAD(P)H-binding protein [Marinococcus halophilus]OZT78759.1 hypothetical protein CHL76_16265 [Marinococcus halophilus]GEK60276.1 hypothetical protein MHA01_31810 [Marinococcus halophilus]
MKAGIIGASGKAGSRILKEAEARGIEVTAIVRDASKLSGHSMRLIEKDLFSLTASDIKDFDVLVNAFGAGLGEEEAHVEAGHHLISIIQEAPDTRLIVVGGAGSLFTDNGKTTQVVETPEFPEAVKPTANGQSRNLQELQQATGIRWTFISPAVNFDVEGRRTGSYSTSQDVLPLNSDKESYLSYADYAVAVVDEIESPVHENQRFAVVGERQ